MSENGSRTLLKDVLFYQTAKEGVYYFNKQGWLFRTDFSFQKKEKINKEPFPLQRETPYELVIFEENVFLKEGKILYFLNPFSKSFEKLLEQIQSIVISPNSEKICYFNNNEIWLLFLKEQNDQPKRKKTDKIFLTRFFEKIGDVSWLTDYYLIFNVKDKIKIIEIDNRDKINIVDLARYENSKTFWNQFDKKTYILSEGKLYQSEKLTL